MYTLMYVDRCIKEEKRVEESKGAEGPTIYMYIHTRAYILCTYTRAYIATYTYTFVPGGRRKQALQEGGNATAREGEIGR